MMLTSGQPEALTVVVADVVGVVDVEVSTKRDFRVLIKNAPHLR